MKKLLIISLLTLLVFALTSCGDDTTGPKPPPPKTYNVTFVIDYGLHTSPFQFPSAVIILNNNQTKRNEYVEILDAKVSEGNSEEPIPQIRTFTINDVIENIYTATVRSTGYQLHTTTDVNVRGTMKIRANLKKE